MTAFSSPVVISNDGKARKLERMLLSASADDRFPEAWLQRALFEQPNTLPVKEIDPHIGPLVPVCMELETGAGPADILYVTPSGQIVLVETKLWRNPEARREVLAQILDYAKQLTAWTYDDLAREASRSSSQGPGYLLRCVAHTNPNLDASAFVDGINRSLKSGDFLLLVVGDGIRSGAESLVGFLQQYGNLRFSIGLIEVAAYRLSSEEILLQPRILARTEILTRMVIVNERGDAVQESTAPEEQELDNPRNDAGWYYVFWKELIDRLRLDDSTQPIPNRPPKTTNYYLYLPPGKNNQVWLSAYLMQSKFEAGVYISFGKNFEYADEFYTTLFEQRASIESELGFALNWERNDGTGKIWISAQRIGYKDLNDSQDRARVISYLTDTVNRMINAFRHRLSILTTERFH